MHDLLRDLCTSIDVGPAGTVELRADQVAQSPGDQAATASSAVAPSGQSAGNAFKGGERNRLWRNWEPRHRSGDAALYEDFDLLTARLRDLFRNEPVMRKLKRELNKHVISTGIQTFADVLMEDGDPGEQEPDDLFNFESDELFERWSEEEADAEGRLSWPEMQWQHFGELLESGGALMLRCDDADRNRSIPMCWQGLEYEQLDTTLDRPATEKTNRIVRGIEFDNRNRVVAYYLFDAHPHDNFSAVGLSTKSTRVPAHRVIHSYLPDRPSSHIGTPPFSANVQTAKDMDWLIGNELTSAALGALLTLVVKRERGAGSGIGFQGDGSSTVGSSDEYGNNLVKWGRGTVADIGANDSVDVAESNRPNQAIAPFCDLLFMLHGMSAGVSHGRVTGNYKGTSYSAARAMHLDDHAFFIVLQAMAARRFVLPIRRLHTVQAAAYGLYSSISARQFRNRQRHMLRMLYLAPGREQLDPEKETGSAKDRIKAGLSTWQEECGLRGKSWRKIALQQKRERAFFKKHGIEPDLDHSAAYLARRAAEAGLPEDTGEEASPEPTRAPVRRTTPRPQPKA